MHINGPFLDPHSSQVCETILRALPDWFGIEEAVVDYAKAAAQLPTLVAQVDETIAGFLTIQQHNPYAAEIYVMGVLPEYHHQGIGRALVQQAETYLRNIGVEYLQVKTLADTHPDLFYARTRAFYVALGFRPLEVLPMLWNLENPCLIMVKAL
jgi:ribosomal protein S18 acetylase RimI-like enzyme